MLKEILPQREPKKIPDEVVIALVGLVGRAIAVAVKKARKAKQENEANEFCEAN